MTLPAIAGIPSKAVKKAMEDLSTNFRDLPDYVEVMEAMRRLAIKACKQAEVEDPLAQRQALQDKIDKVATNGTVVVEVWERDCDLCEATRIVTLPAHAISLERYEQKVAWRAEGPFSLTLLSKAEAERFQPWTRDRAAEMMNY